jgi:hypothetical protein
MESGGKEKKSYKIFKRSVYFSSVSKEWGTQHPIYISWLQSKLSHAVWLLRKCGKERYPISHFPITWARRKQQEALLNQS